MNPPGIPTDSSSSSATSGFPASPGTSGTVGRTSNYSSASSTPSSASTQATKALTSLEDCVREHPVSTLLCIGGLGLAAVFIARALAPPPQNRALSVLEDIKERLAELAEEGSAAISRGAHHVSDLDLDRTYAKVSRKLRGLFH